MSKRAKEQTQLDKAADQLEKEIKMATGPVYTPGDIESFFEDFLLTRGGSRYTMDMIHEWRRKVKKDMEEHNV